MKVGDLKAILKTESRDWVNFNEQLKTNKAFIYYLKSGKVILLPSDVLNKSDGILFDNKDCYLECVKADKFPIDNPEMPTYEKCQSEIMDLPNSMNKIIMHLDTLLKRGAERDLINVENLSKLLQKLKQQDIKLSPKDKLYMAFALGEYIRRSKKADWLLLKYYGKYNPYYIPALFYPDSRQILLILDAFQTFFADKTITPEKYANYQLVCDPGFSFDTLKLSKYPNPYKFLK